MRARALPALLLAALTIATWGAVPWGSFHFDDYGTIVQDEATRSLPALADRLGHGVRPLLRISFFLDHALWGMKAGGFLATNLALHLGAVLLVHSLARRRLGSGAAAFGAAACFALQPAHAEAVAYVSGRSTGLMTALFLAGLLAWEASYDDRRWRIVSLMLFGCAVLAKEVALVFPALLWLWERSRPAPQGLLAPGAPSPTHSPAVRLAAPASAALALFALLALLPRYRTLARYSASLRGPFENLALNARAVPEMLSLWVRPWSLSVDHAFDPSSLRWILGGLLVLAACTAAIAMGAFLEWRHAPSHGSRPATPRVTLAFAAGWALLALAPTNSFVAKLDLVTEKPLYLAWFGPSLFLGAALGAGLERLATPAARRAAASAFAMLLAAGAAFSVWRASLWRDPRLLWLDAVTKAPEKSRAWNNLGMACFLVDRDDEAAAAFSRAVELDPSNRSARFNLDRLLRLR